VKKSVYVSYTRGGIYDALKKTKCSAAPSMHHMHQLCNEYVP
jgi:hypothetical protein